MERLGPAIHSDVSFDESDAVGLLERLLESKKTIKTFFKTNDRTPNYDGTFELVDDQLAPRKQFVVQIKKVNQLKKNTRGQNKDKYVYRLETPFLYYIKNKVTESPAIYFVIDKENRRVFWKYLSDEFLMSLNFEGKTKVIYGFSEEDILSDIEKFTAQLTLISRKRNRLQLYKTPSEIAELQDALDYINHLMDYELRPIKELMFPELWRFGINFSDTSDFEFSVNGKIHEINNKKRLFSLYPQLKGQIDFGVREFSLGEGFFEKWDLSGTISPKEYCEDTIVKIIDSFCKELPIKCLPDIALFEYVQNFIEHIKRHIDIPSRGNKYRLSEIIEIFCGLARMPDYLLFECDEKDSFEIPLRDELANGIMKRRKNFLSIVSDNYIKLYKKHDNPLRREKKFSSSLLDYLKKEDIKLFVVLCEIDHRGLEYVPLVWEYDFWNDFYFAENGKHKIQKAESAFKVLAEILPNAYEQLYMNIFGQDETYAYKYRYEYKFDTCNSLLNEMGLSIQVKQYPSDRLSLSYNSNLIYDQTVEDVERNLISRLSAMDFDFTFRSKMLINESLACLIHKGIGKRLGIRIRTGMNTFL